MKIKQKLSQFFIILLLINYLPFYTFTEFITMLLKLNIRRIKIGNWRNQRVD